MTTHATGGTFKSALGTVVEWTKDQDGASKRNSLLEMRRRDDELLTAWKQRTGNAEVPRSILIHGFRPDEQPQTYEPPKTKPKDFGAAVEACEQQLSMAAPHEKKMLQGRLERMKVAKAEYDEKKQAEQAEQARRESPQVKTCLRVGETCVAVLEKDSTVDQALCDRARLNLAKFKQHYDTEAFAAEDAEIMAEYEQHRAARYSQAQQRASDAFSHARSLHAEAQTQKPE